VVLLVSQHPDPLTLITAKQNEIGELEKDRRAVRVSGVKLVKLPSGSAVVISYGSNSELNPDYSAFVLVGELTANASQRRDP
jgi:hypothetical protein